jgi:flavin reductase (DIM6/NTAB) family NADH-FMN oxidoreductase RutF
MVTVGLRHSRHSYATVMATREFVVNLPTSKQREAVELCGTTSGKQSDKFAAAGLGKLPANLVSAPLIAECPINLECKVRHVLPLGSHVLFVAEIVQTHAHHGLLGEDGQLDDQALDFLAWGSQEFLRVVASRKHLLVPRFQ